MAKKKGKQPYIPLYIGDWLQDTDCLSIDAEGAWLRVVFKCWKNKGIFSATEDVFARLCKVSNEKFASILLEWQQNDICDISAGEDGILTIVSRRIKREKEISDVKSENGSKGGSKTQANKAAKGKAKSEQIPDSDNEDEDDISKKEKEPIPPRGTVDDRLDEALDEIYIDQLRPKWGHIDFNLELFAFIEKVRGSPDHYADHSRDGIRNALIYQLKNAKKKQPNGKQFSKNDRTQQNANDIAIILNHAAGGSQNTE